MDLKDILFVCFMMSFLTWLISTIIIDDDKHKFNLAYILPLQNKYSFKYRFNELFEKQNEVNFILLVLWYCLSYLTIGNWLLSLWLLLWSVIKPSITKLKNKYVDNKYGNF